jgi:dipeptidyl aminopeptidase/acylaminoacyl peptidase
MHTLRTRFAKDIVTEFLPPSRSLKKQRVVILCDGAPTVPSKKALILDLTEKGFWVFHPRYRGSWESGGKFLQHSLDKDILAVVDGLSQGFTDLHFKKKYKLKPDEIILLGGSFGGPAQLLASLDERINKVVCFAPVIDWRKLGKAEPLKSMEKYYPLAYGNGYRVVSNGWKKLASGKFYNPMLSADKIDGNKIMIIHAKDDQSCPYSQSKAFAETTGSKLITLKNGGHLGTSLLFQPRFEKLFLKFINSK